MDFDVYQCIRNEEIRKFFREHHKLSVGEQIQLILHSYASIQKKRQQLAYLQEGIKQEQELVTNMLDLVDACLEQIYHTTENVLYVAEYRRIDEPAKKTDCLSLYGADLNFFDNMEELSESINQICSVEEEEVNQEIYVYQLIKYPGKRHRIKIEFSFHRIDGKWELFRMFPDKEWMERKGISEETVDYYYDTGISYRELPFKKVQRCDVK